MGSTITRIGGARHGWKCGLCGSWHATNVQPVRMIPGRLALKRGMMTNLAPSSRPRWGQPVMIIAYSKMLRLGALINWPARFHLIRSDSGKYRNNDPCSIYNIPVWRFRLAFPSGVPFSLLFSPFWPAPVFWLLLIFDEGVAVVSVSMDMSRDASQMISCVKNDQS